MSYDTVLSNKFIIQPLILRIQQFKKIAKNFLLFLDSFFGIFWGEYVTTKVDKSEAKI